MSEPTGGTDLPDRVRATCARVCARAQWVTLHPDRIADWLAGVDVDLARAAASAERADADPVADPERAAALALASVAVSFTSGWHDIMPKRPGMSGSVSVVARLTDYEHATGALTPERLARFTPEDASQVFETPLDGGALEELVTMLAATLNELGQLGAHHGSYADLISNARGSAVRLADALVTLPSFDDTASHRGATVEFHKRAQLAAATVHRTFRGEGLGRFEDLDRLTIFADNLVPHVLRIDGIIDLDADVVSVIDAGELLEHGSEPEVELRAAAVQISERMVEHLAERGTPMSAADIDHWLWSRGGGPDYKARPRHRCRNPFY